MNPKYFKLQRSAYKYDENLPHLIKPPQYACVCLMREVIKAIEMQTAAQSYHARAHCAF